VKLLAAAHLALCVRNKKSVNQYTVADDAKKLCRMAKRHWRIWLHYHNGDPADDRWDWMRPAFEFLSYRWEERMRALVKPYKVRLVFRRDPRQATVRLVSGRKNDEVTHLLE